MYIIEQYRNLSDNLQVYGFVLKNHYLHSLCRGTCFVFAIYDHRKQLKGVAAFGTPVGRAVQSKYGVNGKLVIELKRFVLKDCKKNTASWFIAQCISRIKLLKSVCSIITYADPQQGHEGTIYKASNFKYLGKQLYQSRSVYYQGKNHHLRSVYQNTKIGKEMQTLIKEGKLASKGLPKKHIYIYKLENTK